MGTSLEPKNGDIRIIILFWVTLFTKLNMSVEVFWAILWSYTYGHLSRRILGNMRVGIFWALPWTLTMDMRLVVIWVIPSTILQMRIVVFSIFTESLNLNYMKVMLFWVIDFLMIKMSVVVF